MNEHVLADIVKIILVTHTENSRIVGILMCLTGGWEMTGFLVVSNILQLATSSEVLVSLRDAQTEAGREKPY